MCQQYYLNETLRFNLVAIILLLEILIIFYLNYEYYASTCISEESEK